MTKKGEETKGEAKRHTATSAGERGSKSL